MNELLATWVPQAKCTYRNTEGIYSVTATIIEELHVGMRTNSVGPHSRASFCFFFSWGCCAEILFLPRIHIWPRLISNTHGRKQSFNKPECLIRGGIGEITWLLRELATLSEDLSWFRQFTIICNSNSSGFYIFLLSL